MRLSRYLADAGIASRRKAEKLITEGKIKVNGIIVKEQGFKINPNTDVIEYNGKRVENERKIYLLLNKPAGYISSVSDPHGRPTVRELIKDINERIYPVGRLDLDTEGLLIMTNDGEFTNLMIHPRYEINKTYEAWVEGKVGETDIDKLRNGILLEDGMTAPAKVEVLAKQSDKTLLSIQIHEGRKRQVRRMCSAIKHPVISLKRTQFAFLKIQGLRLGQYRFLTPDEISRLIKIARGEINKDDTSFYREWKR